MIDFNQRILMTGCGVVAKAVLPMLLKHLRVLPRQITVIRTDTDHPDHAVVEVWQRGWRRGTSLFRPAKVVVNDRQRHSSPPAPPHSEL